MLTMNTDGVEFSIAGCVEKMVCDPNPMSFFYFYFYFLFFFIFYIMCFVLINYWEKRLRAALAMVKKEPRPLFFVSNPAPGKEPSTQVSLVRDQPHTSHAK